MSIARHHNEWLSLLEVSGPFLSLPVLMRVFPQGLEEQDSEARTGHDAEFDVALSFEVLEHTPSPTTYIGQVYRMMKPGGTAVFTTPNTSWAAIHWFVGVTGLHHSEGPHRFVPRQEIIDLLTGAGFKILREKTSVLIPDGPGFLLRAGRLLEERVSEGFMRRCGLRRIFIVQK